MPIWTGRSVAIVGRNNHLVISSQGRHLEELGREDVQLLSAALESWLRATERPRIGPSEVK